jgi:hypothetical protein
MWHKFSILIYWGCLFIGFLSFGTTENHTVAVADEFISDTEQLSQIAIEFRGLRVILGQFDGGTWDNDVDRWMGRKHKLMLQLSFLIAEGEYSKSEIIQLLNSPDHIIQKGDYFYEQIAVLRDDNGLASPSDEYLIYYWRGKHDFLFFTCKNRMIVSADWWYGGD